jgi:hypothetical protein
MRTGYGLVFGAALALALPAVSAAATKTTQPSEAIVVNVNINDRGIKTAMFHSESAGASEYWAAFYALRGEIAYFVIRNQGKKPHNFAVLGKKTRTIRPGGTARFHLPLTRRGKFPYLSTLDKGKKGFQGVLTVA